MDAFGNGLLLGLLLSVLIGPVFFALIQTSIEKGFRSGFIMAIGISLSDALYIMIAYWGINRVIDDESFKMFLGLFGGGIMFVFGLVSIFKPVKKLEVIAIPPSGKTNFAKQLSKGFLLNGANPFVLLFWVGVISMMTINYQYQGQTAYIFFLGIISVVFTADLTKAYVADKLSSLISPRFMQIMNRIVGIALILFSFRLFYYAIFPETSFL